MRSSVMLPMALNGPHSDLLMSLFPISLLPILLQSSLSFSRKANSEDTSLYCKGSVWTLVVVFSRGYTLCGHNDNKQR